MPLHLKIENETSLPDGGPVSFTVTPQRGIDIGRDEFLDWCLPDPTRFISGKHCEIRFSNGQYWLRDVSTNGTFINRSEFRPDGPQALKSGDQIEIGRYIVSVRIEPDAAEGFASGVPHRADVGAGQPVAIWDIGQDAPPPINPNELRARPAAGNGSDFLDWAADIAPAQPLAPSYASPPAPSFAPPPAYAPEPPPQPTWDLPAPARPSSLPQAPAPAGWALEPAAVAPSPAPVASSLPPAPVDPVLSSIAPMPPPSVEAPVPMAAAPVPQPAAPPFVSTPATPPSPDTAPVPMSPRPAAVPSAGPMVDFAARFAKAAGIPEDVVRSRDTGELADLLGQFVRITADNLRQLHAARAQSKGAMRSANVTMIQLMDNNPLRFSPTTDDALKIIFGPATNSYLDASRTLDSSFSDLKKHQVQVFSAMQTALRQLIADLDPKGIEASVPTDKSVGALLRSREARLWDHYQTVWKARAGTSDHGMLDVFMRLFADAYDKS